MIELERQYEIALSTFAHRHGRTWKSKLRDMWAMGTDVHEEYGSYLRALRNSPAFDLSKYRLGRQRLSTHSKSE